MNNSVENSKGNTITYKIAKKEDGEKVANFILKHFLTAESINSSLGHQGLDFDYISQKYGQILSHGVTMLAMQSQEIIGVAVNELVSRNTSCTGQQIDLATNERHRVVESILSKLSYLESVFEDNEKKSVLNVHVLGVRKEFRGRRIASSLMEETFKLARQNSCLGVALVATSGTSRKIASKFQMDEISRMGKDKVLQELLKGSGTKQELDQDLLQDCTGHFVRIGQKLAGLV